MIKGLIVDFNCLFLGRMRGGFDKFKMIFLVFNRVKDFFKSWGCIEEVFFLLLFFICFRGCCGDIKFRSGYVYIICFGGFILV